MYNMPAEQAFLQSMHYFYPQSLEELQLQIIKLLALSSAQSLNEIPIKLMCRIDNYRYSLVLLLEPSKFRLNKQSRTYRVTDHMQFLNA